MRKFIANILMYFLSDEFFKMELRLEQLNADQTQMIDAMLEHEEKLKSVAKKSKIKL